MVQKLKLKKSSSKLQRKSCNSQSSICHSSTSADMPFNCKTSKDEEALSYADLLKWLSDAKDTEAEPAKVLSTPRESSQRTRFHRDSRKAGKIETSGLEAPKKLPKALMKNVRKPVNRSSQAKLHSLKQSAAGKWKKSIDYEVDFFYEDSEEEDRLSPPMGCSTPLSLQLIEHRISVPHSEEEQDFEELDQEPLFLPAALEAIEVEEFQVPMNHMVTWNPPEKANLRLTGFEALKAKYPTYELGNGTPRSLTLDLTPYLDPSSELAAHRRDHCPNSSRIANLCLSTLENGPEIDRYAVNFHVSWSYSGLAQANALNQWLQSIERQQKSIRIDALIIDFLDGFLSRVYPPDLDWINCSRYALVPTRVFEVVSDSSACLILQEAGEATGPVEQGRVSPLDLDQFASSCLSDEDLAMICGACLDFIDRDGYLQLDECEHILCVKCWTQHLYGCLEDIFNIPLKGREYLSRLADLRSIFSCPVEHCTSCPNQSTILKFFNVSVLNPIYKAVEFAKWFLEKQDLVSPEEALFACPEKSCSRIFHSPAQCQGNVKGIECAGKSLLPLCCSSLQGILFPWPALDPKSPNCLYYKHEFHWPASCEEASIYHSVLSGESDCKDRGSHLSTHPLFATVLEARSLRTLAIKKNASKQLKQATTLKIGFLISALSVAEYTLVHAVLKSNEEEDWELEMSTACKILELCASLKGQKFSSKFGELEPQLSEEMAKIKDCCMLLG